jgi:hypothetical protein
VQLLIRIAAVLRWWYDHTGQARNAMDTLGEFAPALGKMGVTIDLPTPREIDQVRDDRLTMSNAASQMAHKRWSGKQKQEQNGKKKK